MRPGPPPMPPPMPNRPCPRPVPWLPVTRLRVGRVVLLAVLGLTVVLGGAIWLLMTKARPFPMPNLDNTAWPAWMRQAQTYPTSAPDPPKPAPPATDPNAALLAKLAALQAELERQRQELEALKKRPAGTTVVPPAQGQAAKVPPPPKAHASMLFVAHDSTDVPPKPSVAE
jgi:hypothetical protein